MVAAPPIPAARIVATIAAATSAHVVQLTPSAFDPIEGENVRSVPTRSSDAGALALRLADAADAAEAGLPVSVLLPGDVDTISSLVPHLSSIEDRPIVLHFALVSKTVADHAAITSGPLRSAGLPILYTRSASDAAGMTAVAHRAAFQSGRAVAHFFEVGSAGDHKSPTKANLTAARKFVSIDTSGYVARNGQVNGHENGRPTGNDDAEANGDVDMSETRPSVSDALRSSFAAVPAALRVAASSYVGAKLPKSLVVSLSATDAPKSLPSDAGFISLAQLQARSDPYANLIPASAERVVVLEQAHDRPARWPPLFLDLLSSLHTDLGEDRIMPRIVSRTLGVASASEVDAALSSALEADATESGIIGEQPEASGLALPPRIPAHERAYTKLLESTFASRLRVVNAPDGFATALRADADTSPSYALGSLLGKQQSSAALQVEIRALLTDSSRSSSLATSSRDSLSQWQSKPTDAALIKRARAAIDDDAALESLRAHAATFEDLTSSSWIIGSDAWAYDIGSSGVHHALASGLDVNILIIDSAPYPPDALSARGKKDIGLYALNYGNAYVASVAVYGDYAQTARALVEADQYRAGPSIVLAYLPGGDHDEIKALEVLKQTKKAVDSGHWPLYRFDPTKRFSAAWPSAGDPAEAFQLDSERIKADLRAFIDRQSHLSLLSASEPTYATELGLEAGYGMRIRRAHESRALKAFERLTGAVDGPPLLILFASDGGNAEKVARRLNMRARARGLGARVEVFDSVEPDDLALEGNVVFITSTAGQGEFPQNGRNLWKKLQARPATTSPAGDATRSLEPVKFAVFAMGDSN